MTRIFTDDGVSIPVSVIEVAPYRVTQVKNVETDGYSAVQVTVGSRRPSRVSSPLAGHFAKANAEAGRGWWELRNDSQENFEVGSQATVDTSDVGQKIDVPGSSKGKCLAGAVSRCSLATHDSTHGRSA